MENLWYLIKEFFTGRPSAIQINYVVMAVSAFGYLAFRFLPFKRIFKYHRVYDWKKYDEVKAREQSLRLNLGFFLYSLILAIVLHLAGERYYMYGFYAYPVFVIIFVLIIGDIPKKRS